MRKKAGPNGVRLFYLRDFPDQVARGLEGSAIHSLQEPG